MGFTAAASVGMSAYTAYETNKQGQADAKALIAEGNIVSKNKAKEIEYKAASQTVSFLNSGLTLDGTPRNVIDSTYKTGIQDLNQIRKNYNTGAKNIASKARTDALKGFASSVFQSFSMSAFGTGGNLDQIGSGGSNISYNGYGRSGWGSGIVNYNGGIDPGGEDIFTT